MKIFLSCLLMSFAVAVSFELGLLISKVKLSAMFRYKLVPDVVDTTGKGILKVTFPSGAEAKLGNKLTPTQVKDQPCVSNLGAKTSYSTLVFIDADYPKNTSLQFLHGLWVNIPDGEVTKGEAIAPYISSGPLKGSGYHRYLFLVFEQSGKLQFDEKRLDNKSMEGRDNFTTREFAKKYSLGNPVSANFFLAKYDDYVPTLYKSLGAESLLEQS